MYKGVADRVMRPLPGRGEMDLKPSITLFVFAAAFFAVAAVFAA